MLYRCKVYHYLNIWSRIVCKCLHLFRERGWWGRLYKTRPDGFLPFNAKQDEEEEKLKLYLHPTFGNLPARKVYKLSLQISFFVRFKLWFCNARVGMASKWKVNRSQVILLDYRSETTSFANSVFIPSFVTVIIRLLTAVMFLQSQVELLQDNRNVITLIASRDFQFHIRKTFPTDKRKLLNPQLGKCRWFIFQEHRHSYTSRPLATHNASSIVCMIYHDIRNELYSTRNEWPIL